MPRSLRVPRLSMLATVALLAACRAGVAGAPVMRPAPGPVTGEAAAAIDVPAGAVAELPYLVRRGWLELTTSEPAAVASRAQRVTSRLGGMIERAEIGDDRADLVVRVPEPRLDEAMDSLSTLGSVASRSLSADDVTDQVIDLEARVASLRGVRDRLRAMLDRATSMPDVMTIERELSRVQAEIDSIEGRLRHLRSHAVMAELSLSVHRERKLGPIGWLIAGVATALGKLFILQ